MSAVAEITVPVAPMTAAAFAPYGEVFGLGDGGAGRVLTQARFEHDGRVTLATIWNPAGETAFSRLERHHGVTQAFVQLCGGESVVCVAPPTDLDDPSSLPAPDAVRGFVIDPGQGFSFHRGTWHALDRCVLAPPGATFLIVNVAPNPTQIVDFAAATSEVHDDLGVSTPRALPWPRRARCRFRLAAR